MSKAAQWKRIVFSLLPLTIVILIIYLLPLVNTSISAFQGFTGKTAGQFVGLDNFRQIQKDIPHTLRITLIWTFGSVIPAVLLGLGTALLFVRSFRGKNLFLTLNLLPYAIPLIIVAACWTYMYNQNFGLINVALTELNIIEKPIHFFQYGRALTSVIVARIWRAMPFAFINFYAALTSIPTEYYEAASVDGATPFQQLVRITLPNLRSIAFTTTIVLTVWTFLVFDIIYGMTGGGPVDATNIIPVRIYRELFNMKDMGAASAWSMIAITILLVITAIYWKLFGGGQQDNA